MQGRIIVMLPINGLGLARNNIKCHAGILFCLAVVFFGSNSCSTKYRYQMANEISKEEPSMEEILASIRRIISEDGEEGSKHEGPLTQTESDAMGSTSEPAAKPTDEVLELTEEVDEDGNVIASSEAATELATVGHPPAEENEPQSETIVASSPPLEPLMEVSSEDVAVSAFAALASQVSSGSAEHRAQAISPSERTLEDHVLEMLRPMLREWLDKHLPEMVQRLVQREIDRITHRSNPV